jgi:hypothetical protein
VRDGLSEKLFVRLFRGSLVCPARSRRRGGYLDVRRVRIGARALAVVFDDQKFLFQEPEWTPGSRRDGAHPIPQTG